MVLPALLAEAAPGMISQGIGLASSLFGANEAANAAGAKRKALQDIAYQQQLGMTGAETELMKGLNTPSAELEQVKKNMQAQTGEEMGQLSGQIAAQQAGQGVRGGQASTLQNRQVGEMARGGLRDVTQTAYQDYLNKLQQKTGYLGKKASTAQQQQFQAAQNAIQ